jgi:hypothetical protein
MDDTNALNFEYSEDSGRATDASERVAGAAADSAIVDDASEEFLGRWNRLVSTTNWEKGRIISQWRGALLEAGVPASECTDDAWARRVGNATPQHVGRLRRVYERFGQVFQEYPGLYWSHFQAALDWHDAEMWLEGAVHNGWSVARMRRQRWQAAGALAADEPRPDDIVAEEVDADGDAVCETIGEVRDVAGAEAIDEAAPHADENAAPLDAADELPPDPAAEPVRPFENLATLPPDLAEPYEALKLAILGHKVAGWREIACGEVLAALDALKQLAVAPA